MNIPVSTEELTNYFAGKNMALFDYQTEMLIFLMGFKVRFIIFMQDYVDIQMGVYESLQYIQHPLVSTCTDSVGANPSDCGPFQLFWDNYITLFNNATVNQQTIYPWIKGVVILFDFTFLSIFFSVPIAIEASTKLTKFYELLSLEKNEYARQQFART